MHAFQPLGERSRWRVIYEDLLSPASVGDVITYREIGRALSLHPDDDRHVIQMAMRRAAKEHLKADLRAVAVVPNEGYKVVEPGKQLALSKGQQGRMKRAGQRASDFVTYVDLSGESSEVQRAFALAGAALTMQQELIERLDIRQRRLEQQVQAATTSHKLTAEQIANLLSRVEKLESGT